MCWRGTQHIDGVRADCRKVGNHLAHSALTASCCCSRRTAHEDSTYTHPTRRNTMSSRKCRMLFRPTQEFRNMQW